MDNLASNAPLKKLPVLATIWVAFCFGWDHRRVLWPWIVVGAILTGLVNTADYYLSSGYDESSVFSKLEYFLIIFIAWMPSTFIFIVVAINCHRSVLVFRWEKSGDLQIGLTSREGRFLVWILLVYATSLICSIPLSMTVGTLWLNLNEIFAESTWIKDQAEIFLIHVTFLLPFFYIVGRWILVFPAIAIDQHPKLSWSWKQTKGNGWRMCLLVGFLPWTVGNLWSLFPFFGLSEFPVLGFILGSFILFIYIPIQVAAISIAFRELTNLTPSSQSSQST